MISEKSSLAQPVSASAWRTPVGKKHATGCTEPCLVLPTNWQLIEQPTIKSSAVVAAAEFKPEEFEQAWKTFLEMTLPPEEMESTQDRSMLQADCRPFKINAAGTGKRSRPKGTVVLFHGFSACPQQYYDVARDLAQRGYTVVVPLLPGHGRRYGWKRKSCKTTLIGKMASYIKNKFRGTQSACAHAIDNSKHVPTNVEQYVDFVKRVNVLMSKAAGTRVVGGLSLGGAVALYTGATEVVDASSGKPTSMLYQRQLITVPLLDMGVDQNIAGRTVSIAGAVFEGLAGTGMGFGWGEDCEVERAKGRAGFCNFKVKNVDTGKDLGRNTLAMIMDRGRRWRELGFSSQQQTQLMLVEGDGAVSNNAVVVLKKALDLEASESAACMADAAIGHSFLARYDGTAPCPASNKYWLKSVIESMVQFITEGKAFPAGANPAVEDTETAEAREQMARCRISCTADDEACRCSWPYAQGQCPSLATLSELRPARPEFAHSNAEDLGTWQFPPPKQGMRVKLDPEKWPCSGGGGSASVTADSSESVETE